MSYNSQTCSLYVNSNSNIGFDSWLLYPIIAIDHIIYIHLSNLYTIVYIYKVYTLIKVHEYTIYINIGI